MVRTPKQIDHRLPGAASFVGRLSELHALSRFVRDGRGVLSLVGMGGAGKTAILQRFLETELPADIFDRVFIWSFYDDPDTNAFLRTAVEALSGEDLTEAAGTGWFFALKQALESGKRYLFVLDGLERVQRPLTDAQGIYGEVEDPLLRGFLLRIATSEAPSQALITSRFPIADLERSLGRGYAVIDVDQLDLGTAFEMLRGLGVQGDDESLTRLTKEYGRHALTLELLGAAAHRHFGSVADGVPPLQMISQDSESEQASRLAYVLDLVQNRLGKRELEMMNRICVFRFGVSVDSLAGVFRKGDVRSGLLAGSSRPELSDLLEALADARLVHREPEEKYTVHPAVRDHFYRLFRDAAEMHGAITSHLLTLSQRPGIGLPVAKESLDLLEELIHHSIGSHDEDLAAEIYYDRMGASDHLNVTLGEYGRTFRILGAFRKCPDAGGMYQCLRSFGSTAEALKWRTQNRYILLSNGRITELRDDPSETTRRVARFLQGERVKIPDRLADFPMSAAHLYLMANDVEEAERAAMYEIRVSLYQDDIIRSELALADIARRRGRLDVAASRISAAEPWVLHSSSHEHLCTLHLFRGRLAFDQGQYGLATSALEEGLQLVAQSSYLLFGIELKVALARIKLASRRASEAISIAREAAEESALAETRFVWGALAAHRVLADAAMALEHRQLARDELKEVLRLQIQVNDSSSSRTEMALHSLGE